MPQKVDVTYSTSLTNIAMQHERKCLYIDCRYKKGLDVLGAQQYLIVGAIGGGIRILKCWYIQGLA